MADKDSWWKDDSENSGGNTSNPFKPRDTQNDGSSFNPRSVNEGFKPRLELSDRKIDNQRNNP